MIVCRQVKRMSARGAAHIQNPRGAQGHFHVLAASAPIARRDDEPLRLLRIVEMA